MSIFETRIFDGFRCALPILRVLPRAMRADICNGYECGGLWAARDHFQPATGGRSFIVVRHDHRIQRSAFIDGPSIRHCPPEEQDR